MPATNASDQGGATVGGDNGAEYAPTDTQADEAGDAAADQSSDELDEAGLDNNDQPAIETGAS